MNTEKFDKLLNYNIPLNQQNVNLINDRILADKNVNINNIGQFCGASNYAYDKVKQFNQDKYTVLGQQTGEYCGMLGDSPITRKVISYNELNNVSSLNKSDVGIDFFAPPFK